MDKENLIDSAVKDEQLAEERRQHPRAIFAYPVEFKIFCGNPVTFDGFLEDISRSGACLTFKDKYGRLNFDKVGNSQLRLSLSMPEGNNVIILAQIKWFKKIPKTVSYKIGIEFQYVENWQLEVIENLIGMKNKDHNMMWNLWKQYTESSERDRWKK
ncbi:MAG: PilZ domain-containing protein [Dissulfuribacterales bacterium]